jgi:hypothetical protein
MSGTNRRAICECRRICSGTNHLAYGQRHLECAPAGVASSPREAGRTTSSPGSGISASSAECSRRRLLEESGPGLSLRFPSRGEAMWSSRRYDSSSDFLTSSAATVRERTISNARKPTMSVVSSLDLRSSCVGRLRNSLNRLAGDGRDSFSGTAVKNECPA